MKNDYGKGDKRRPFDPKRWCKGWDRVYGKKGKNVLALAKKAAARQAKKTKKDIEKPIARVVDDVKDAAD